MKYRKLSDEEKAQIVRLIGMGWTYSMISDELKFCDKTIRKVCREAGVSSSYKTRAHRSPEKDRLRTERYESWSSHRYGGPQDSNVLWEEE